jgi:hypothetical protein
MIYKRNLRLYILCIFIGQLLLFNFIITVPPVSSGAVHICVQPSQNVFPFMISKQIIKPF